MGFFLLGAALFTLRAADLWAEPYQVGRVWQSFDIIAELERVGGVPWKTELSSMSGGTGPAPFIQEFPLAQYAALTLRRVAGFSVPASGQIVAIATALCAVLVLFAHSASLGAPGPVRLALASAVLFIPGFLRYGLSAVPDATVFLFNAAGAALIFTGRRRGANGPIVLGAVWIGAAVLAKATALIPAAVVAALLFYDRRRAAAAALALAAVPGAAWAFLSTRINPHAAEVNEFARLAGIREYWWNPALYVDPWWYRNLAFVYYDTLGLLGIALIAAAAVAALRRRRLFELGLLVLPALALSAIFNYHSASHPYYHLVWLPLSLVAAAEMLASLSLTTAPSRSRLRIGTSEPRASASGMRDGTPVHAGEVGQSLALRRPPRPPGAAVAAIVALGLFGAAERAYGLVERASGKAEAAQGYLSLPGAPPRNAELEAGLRKLAKEPGAFIACLGDACPRFQDLGLRGWIVDSPRPPNPRVPPSVTAAEEWRRVGRNWIEDRMRRGLQYLLIERASPWSEPAFLNLAKSCGFVPHAELGGHILLERPAATPPGDAPTTPRATAE